MGMEQIYQENNATVTVNNVTVDLGCDTYAAGDMPVNPVIMFIEDKDKYNSDARSVILLNTTDDSDYSELNNILFSDSKDEQTWDETKLTGYLTTYGTYALKDTTDTNINLGSISYGGAQMYADVYMAEIDASITAGASASGASQIGDILVKDSEVSSVATKNLIVVGGSCINASTYNSSPENSPTVDISSSSNGPGLKVTNLNGGNAAYIQNAQGTTADALYVTTSGSGRAGYFNGDVHVNGTFSKNAGSFLIDHPYDPANKYLAHSFVESPDMMNVYNGNVILDNKGVAIVELPYLF